MRIELARAGDRRLQVSVDGRPLSPKRSQRVWNHSPDGFECGYAGSGPAQLALAVLLAAHVPPRRAVRWHQQFKADFVQHWHAPRVVEIDVATWLADAERMADDSG